MIEVPVDANIIELSKSRAIKMGIINNSIMQGDGSIAGFVGEYIAADILDGEVMDTYDYDILLRNRDTVDVKTKRVSSAPRDYYPVLLQTITPNRNVVTTLLQEFLMI